MNRSRDLAADFVVGSSRPRKPRRTRRLRKCPRLNGAERYLTAASSRRGLRIRLNLNSTVKEDATGESGALPAPLFRRTRNRGIVTFSYLARPLWFIAV